MWRGQTPAKLAHGTVRLAVKGVLLTHAIVHIGILSSTPSIAFQLQLLAFKLVTRSVVLGEFVQLHGLLLELDNSLIVEVGCALQLKCLPLQLHQAILVLAVPFVISVRFTFVVDRAHLGLLHPVIALQLDLFRLGLLLFSIGLGSIDAFSRS